MTMTDTSENVTMVPTVADRLRTPAVSPLRKNGGAELAHFTPQNRKQRIAAGLLELVVEEGLDIGTKIYNDPKCLADSPTEVILVLLRWAHEEIDQSNTHD